MKIIINADDFGLSSGVNKGIIDVYKAGGLKSTTLMPMAAKRDEAIQLAKENPELGVGVHMTLTTGKPILGKINTLTNKEGNFRFRPDTLEELVDEINLDELYEEWDAQIASIVAEIPVTHFDSHHHVHMHPKFKDIVLRLQEKYNLPCRYNFEGFKGAKVNGGFYQNNVTLDYLEEIFANKENDSIDIMSHPAYMDEELPLITSYLMDRVVEKDLLSSPEFQTLLEKYNIELTNYKYL